METLEQERQGLIDRTMEIFDTITNHPETIFTIARQLGGLHIPACDGSRIFAVNDFDAHYHSERAALLHAIAEKIIPDAWEWEIFEAMGGSSTLVLIKKKSEPSMVSL